MLLIKAKTKRNSLQQQIVSVLYMCEPNPITRVSFFNFTTLNETFLKLY